MLVNGRFQNLIQGAKNAKDVWHSILRSYAHDAGVMGKNSNFTKFIILSRSRTGSNFLRGLLNSHSRIIAFGEIFRNYKAIGWGFAHCPRSKSTLALIQNDPVKFLDSRVFGNFPPHIAAVGFKLFYYHAHNDEWEPVWTHLERYEGLKIIHLKRRNILKTHLSRERAKRVGTWTSKHAVDAGYNTPLTLSYEECLEDFMTTRAWEKKYSSFFANHAMLDLFYEDLARDYVNEMKRAQDFLGVDYEILKPKTLKQSNQPLPKAIENYFQLKTRFQGTPWAEFFEE